MGGVERLARMTRRIDRAVRWAWVGFTVLCALVMIGGVWIGYAQQSVTTGVYVSLMIIGICAGYAMFMAPWQVARKVNAAKGQSTTQEQRVRTLLTPLCEKAGISVPAVIIIPSSARNAFAAGLLPKHQYVGVTLGALEQLNDSQLAAVLAHEVSHIARKDTLYLGWWVAFIGIVIAVSIALFVIGIGMAASGGRARRKKESDASAMGFILALFAVVAGVAAVIIIQLWLRADMRRREVLADEHAVVLTGCASDLASALERLKGETTLLSGQSSLSLLFAFDPVPTAHWWQRLFDTHPDIDWRIRKLRELGRELGEAQ